MMGIIRRSFSHLNVNMFKLLYKTLVRPHIEYSAAVWSPRYISDIKIIQGVQRRATRQLPEMKSLGYQERLKLQLPPLRFRILRGDVIEAYKIMYGIYDTSIRKMFYMVLDSKTRGNCCKFTPRLCGNRCIDELIKNRPDSTWHDHPWIFDFES